MRLHRFYIAEPIGDKKEIIIKTPELINQVLRVFRSKAGDSIVIFDGSGSDYTSCIEGVTKDELKLTVIEATKSRFMPEREIVLCASIVKKDTFEWIVEKATELGVTRITPIISERSEKKSLNEDRLKKIATEAGEQSGRGNVPVIDPIKNLEEEVGPPHGGNRIAFHTEGKRWEMSDTSDKLKKSIKIFIGPEGGWSPSEIEQFHKNNIPIYSLGKQILRAETATIVALSLFPLH